MVGMVRNFAKRQLRSMRPRSAQALLSPRERSLKPSRSALQMLIMLMSLAVTHCVLPNEPLDEPTSFNQPPLIDFASVAPSAAVSRVGLNCASFSIQAEATDPDNATLLFRWVVRDEDDTRHAFDQVSNGAPNTARQAFRRFVLSVDFADQVEVVDNVGDAPVGSRTAVVTLYATDAPSWAIETPDLRGQGQKTGPGDDDSKDYPVDFNLGQIPSFEETGERNSVTSFSWAFEFTQVEPTCLP